MLLQIFLVAFVCSLVSAETCPDGLSCPTGKKCCFEAGQYTCCDPVEDEEDLVPGVPSEKNRNASSDGVQHAYSSDYCPSLWGKKICCSSQSCVAYSECCTASACCFRGLRCCGNGGWCCLSTQKCGRYYRFCRNAGMAFVPALGTIALIAFATIKSKSYFL